MTDHQTTIEPSDGGAAVVVAGVCLIALVLVGVLFFMSVNYDGSKAIAVHAPRVTVSVAPPRH